MRKLLVWDGDNTLWDGTLLEGDPTELPIGRLEMIEQLSERGVLQAIASRNLLDDVRANLHRFGIAQHFLSVQADMTTPKSKMIARIMDDLGLVNINDLVFLDDDAFNREEAKAVGIWSYHPDQLSLVVQEFFTKREYTNEDKNRVSSYRSEIERKRTAGAFAGDYTEFLRSCKMKLHLSTPTNEGMIRVLDLIRRSNQFSLVSGTFSDDDLRQAQSEMIVGSVSDKFGAYGLSSVAWVTDGELKLMVISCRLQNKGIGSALLGWLINRDLVLYTAFVETKYNAQMKNLFEWYKFEQSNVGSVTYYKHVGGTVDLPDWIEIDV